MASRREFIQLLGIGGMALVAESAQPLPLFGSDEQPAGDIIRPEANLLTGHVVVQQKHLTERVPPEERPDVSHYGGVVVARLTRTPVPGGGQLSELTPHHIIAGCDFPEGTNPHMAYYRAAQDLRQQFARLSRQKLLDLPEHLRMGAVIVTVVSAPIMAVPRETARFDVQAVFSQGIRYSTKGLNTFNVYSTEGEYPINVPSNIDLQLMMKLDKEILSDADLLKGDPRKWRPQRRGSILT